jgi:hypothetical protein
MEDGLLHAGDPDARARDSAGVDYGAHAAAIVLAGRKEAERQGIRRPASRIGTQRGASLAIVLAIVHRGLLLGVFDQRNGNAYDPITDRVRLQTSCRRIRLQPAVSERDSRQADTRRLVGPRERAGRLWDGPIVAGCGLLRSALPWGLPPAFDPRRDGARIFGRSAARAVAEDAGRVSWAKKVRLDRWRDRGDHDYRSRDGTGGHRLFVRRDRQLRVSMADVRSSFVHCGNRSFRLCFNQLRGGSGDSWAGGKRSAPVTANGRGGKSFL